MANETTSKLTMIARGLGFEETAKSADALAQAQQRLLDNQVKLAAAQQSGSIGDVGNLTEEQQKLTSVIEALGGAQERDNLRTRDYLKLLREIHPQLAEFVDAGLSAVKVAGRLAQEQIDLNSVMGAAKNAVTQYGGAMKLIAAGSAVILGVQAALAAWQRITEETQRATQAANRYNEALAETNRQQREQQATIEDISDKRREGGLTAEQSEAARAVAVRVGTKFTQLDEGALNTVAGLLPGLDDTALAEAAFLRQIGELDISDKHRARTRMQILDRARAKNAGRIQGFFARETGQRDLNAALEQAQGRVVGTDQLEAFIASLPGNAFKGREADLAKLIQESLSVTPSDVPLLAKADSLGARVNRVAGSLAGDLKRVSVEGEDFIELREQAAAIRSRGTDAVAADVVETRQILRLLQNAIEKATGGTTVIQNNGRYIGADAASRKARTQNGESQRARIERE